MANNSASDESQRRLFVTFSNLSFLPAILIALNWQHFHLAVIYLFTMTWSMLYHWCDSSPLWPSSSDCVLPYDTLQFADFFSAGISAWATLLAMAVIGHRFRLFCLTTAFITFAVSVHSSRFHIATFAIPLAIAGVIVLSSWIYRCRRFHVIYPPNESLIRLSIGVCLTIVSALLYLYFQEGVSYEYVHSTWHIIVQLSACCLLPRPIVNEKPALNSSQNNSTSLISTEAQLLTASRRKSWLAANFPIFDAGFWRGLRTRAFWNTQIDDCCGVIDHAIPGTGSTSPNMVSTLLSPSHNSNDHQRAPASPFIRPDSSASTNADQTSFTPTIG